jgi:hypothetical protein
MARTQFDPTLKALVESAPADWPAFAGLPAGPTDVIDADIATVTGAADKVLRVRAAAPYLMHLEFVSGHDAAALPRKLHVRNVLLVDRHDADVRSVAVLLRPEADSPALTGTYARSFPGEEPYLTFRYRVIRVWQVPASLILAGGVGTLPLAPISDVTEGELPGIIKLMQGRLRGRALRARAASVWAATYVLLGLRYSEEFAHQLLQGVLSMEESVTYQAIIREGAARGAVDEARKLLLLQGEMRFGPPRKGIANAIKRIADLGRLEGLVMKLVSAGSWEDLLATPE